MSFSWPIGATWGGFINPYYKLAGRCPDCTHGYDRAKGRPDANAAFFHDQWYGNVPFDPVAYGAEPLSQFAPAIWRLASRNVGAAPDFYMSHDEQIARRVFKDKAMTNAWDSSDPPLVPFPSFDKDRAITLEAQRLYKLWRYQWGHQLIQADVDALVAGDRLHDFTSTSKEDGWQKREDGYHPTAAEVNAWSLEGFGHDGINSHTCVRARCVEADRATDRRRLPALGRLLRRIANLACVHLARRLVRVGRRERDHVRTSQGDRRRVAGDARRRRRACQGRERERVPVSRRLTLAFEHPTCDVDVHFPLLDPIAEGAAAMADRCRPSCPICTEPMWYVGFSFAESEALPCQPLIAVDRTRIVGCACGWQPSTDTADSDDAFAVHVAVIHALGRPEGDLL
jgi:hypothetical protein